MRKINVLQMHLSDVEDPELYAAEPIIKWEKSEQGKWVIDNSVEKPTFHIFPDQDTYGWRLIITAIFTEQNYVFWKLKYE